MDATQLTQLQAAITVAADATSSSSSSINAGDGAVEAETCLDSKAFSLNAYLDKHFPAAVTSSASTSSKSADVESAAASRCLALATAVATRATKEADECGQQLADADAALAKGVLHKLAEQVAKQLPHLTELTRQAEDTHTTAISTPTVCDCRACTACC